jgi:hypothetical protein
MTKSDEAVDLGVPYEEGPFQDRRPNHATVLKN